MAYSLEYTVKPIARWPGTRRHGSDQKSSPFSQQRTVYTQGGGSYNSRDRGAPWSRIRSEMARELYHLRADSVVLRLDVQQHQLRNDGQIKANAAPSSSAVMLEFTATGVNGHPRLVYKCDVFRDWQSNLYAIVRSLEALRLVDRYEVTTTGEQYVGFKQIGSTSSTTMSAEAAAITLFNLTGDGTRAVLDNPDVAKSAVRKAIAITHPDRNNGERAAYDRVDAARSVLSSHHGVSL